MTQVAVFMTMGEGSEGVAVQFLMMPVVVGVCVTAFPMVSTKVPGLNVTMGVGIDCTLKFKLAAAEPVLFAAVMV